MVRASMATRNKKDVTAIHNTDSQINNEVNMGKFLAYIVEQYWLLP